MAATKSESVISNDVSYTTGTNAFPTVGTSAGLESSELDVSSDYADTVLIEIDNANVSTFTAPLSVRVEVSSDGGTTWWSYALVVGTLGQDDWINYVVPLDPACMRVRTRSGGNAGTSADCTLRVTVERVTGV